MHIGWHDGQEFFTKICNDVGIGFFVLKKFFRQIRQILQEQEKNTLSVELLRGQGFILFFFIITSSMFISFVLSMVSFFGGAWNAGLMQMGTVLVMGSALLIYKKTQNLVWAANYTLILGWVSSFFRAYQMGGVASPNLMMNLMIPLIVFIMLGTRWAVFWCVAYLLIVIVLGPAAGVLGLNLPLSNNLEFLNTARFMNYLSLFVLMTAVMWFFSRRIRIFLQIIQNQREEKANLVKVLSHDLSTPVQVLIGLLGRFPEVAEDKKNEYISRMKKSVEAMSKILNHVKEAEAVSSGKKQLFLEKVDVMEALKELQLVFTETLSQKKIQLEWQVDTNEKYEIMADRSSFLYQVLANFFSNALKFTPQNGKVIFRLSKNADHVVLKIRDQGIGIPENILKNIFSYDHSTSRKGLNGEVGTGFGMPIAKSYLDRFHAQVSIHSEVAKDSAQNSFTEVCIQFPCIESSRFPLT